MVEFSQRHAISRSRFFLKKALECNPDQRDDFEAYIEASIIFARIILHRIKSQYGKTPKWDNKWWEDLLNNEAVLFFMRERNLISKKSEAKMNRVVRPGETQISAGESYYFETPEIPATETVNRHLNSMEPLILDAEKRFG